MKKTLLFLLVLTLVAAGVLLARPVWKREPPFRHRVLVLGCDGMDPALTEQLMNEGRLPHFARLRERGCFKPLGTSTPPQSPVAWSDFITGADARVHALFDFIHRRPNEPYTDEQGTRRGKVSMYLSSSEVREPETFPVGDWRIPKPWGGGGVRQYRRGTPFWEYLTAAGVEVTIFRVPANFPPGRSPGADFCCLAGMGTPDLLGTYGTFAHYSPSETRPERQASGGVFYPLGAAERVEYEPTHDEWRGLPDSVRRKLHYSPPDRLLGVAGRLSGSDRATLLSLFTSAADRKALDRLYEKSHRLRRADEWTGWLVGPENFALGKDDKGHRPRTEIPFRVARDPEHDVASIEVQGQVLVLKRGEWSDWRRVEFKTGLPTMNMAAICRFFLLDVHPELRLYVTPLNIDPENPALPLSHPAGYAAEIADECGLYYTAGIPEDHSALSEKALTDDEYLSQARIVLDERMRQLEFVLKRFHKGALFFYFGSTDQVAHMFWRDRDPQHPTYRPELAEKYGRVIEDVYVEMDRALGKAMEVLDEQDTVIVLSDHGFTTFRRGFNLNTWLRDQGYLKTMPSAGGGDDHLFGNCDWNGTRAYGLGINSLYLNLRGREFAGIVEPGTERDRLLDELRDKLLQVTDPADGQKIIAEVYRTDQIYPGADPHVAPDLIIGYARGYRASWSTVLGGMPAEVVEDNTERWSGDHCVAAHLVPGIILSNRMITAANPRLIDLAPTILAEFGVDKPESMQGRPLY